MVKRKVARAEYRDSADGLDRDLLGYSASHQSGRPIILSLVISDDLARPYPDNNAEFVEAGFSLASGEID